MTPEDLIDLCKEPVRLPGGQLEVPPHIYLTIPKPRLPKGTRTRLAGNKGPLGLICNVSESPPGYSVVAVFSRKEVIEFMEAFLEDAE